MKKIKLENIVDIYNGSTPSTTDVENFGGEIPWVTPKDLADQQKKYISRGERNITEKGLASIGNRLLPTGTILLTSRAPIGLIALSSNPISTNQGFKNIVCDSEKIHNEYLFYKLQTLIPFLQNSGTGTTFKELSKSTLEKISFSIHTSTKTQQEIAKVLYDLDAKIALNNRINEVLEAKAKLLYDYWFVQFEFPASGASAPLSPLDGSRSPRNGGYKSSGGKMVYNKKLKREIPEGWRDGTFEDISTIVSGSTPSKARNEYFVVNKGTPWITPKDLSLNKGNKFITRGEIDVTESGIKSASLKIMPPGTILLSSRAPIGYIAISRENVTTNQGFKSFVPLDNYSADFVYYCVKNEIPKFEAFSSGSTFREISASVLKTVKISIPPENILRCFDNLIKPIFEKQNILEKQNQHLSSLRDWLLPMLMNGQVGVERAYEIVDGELGMVAEPGGGIGMEEESNFI